MASSSPIKNKNGVVYAYQIKVYRGRDADGKQLKPYSTTTHPDMALGNTSAYQYGSTA